MRAVCELLKSNQMEASLTFRGQRSRNITGIASITSPVLSSLILSEVTHFGESIGRLSLYSVDF